MRPETDKLKFGRAKPLRTRIWIALLANPVVGRILAKLTYRPATREDVHKYWMEPWDGINLPQEYAGAKARTQFLVQIVSRHADPPARILEVGCNVGRNLNALFEAGYRGLLAGIEISRDAVRLMKETYPAMAAAAQIYNAAVEDVVRGFGDRAFDLVFTMAVLEHIHTSSEWVFPEIARITNRYLVTIEDERGYSWRHFPRNYQRVFEPLGFRQIEQITCKEIEGLGKDFIARVFVRPNA